MTTVKGKRILLPENQQKTILDQLHNNHQGIEKTRFQARDEVYLNEINTDIGNMIKTCLICQENISAQPKETLQPHDICSRAWKLIGTDLFYLNDHEYSIIASY